MMTCQNIQERMLACDWSAARLEEAATLAAHVRSCAECRRALADYERLRGVLATPASERQAGEERGVIAMRRALRTAAPRSAGGVSVWRVALATAACVALAASGWALRGLAGGAAGPPPVMPTTGGPVGGAHRTPSTPAPGGSAFSPEEVRTSALVFEGVSEALDGRAGWIAQSGKRSDVGLADAPTAGAKSLLLLRLTMSHDGQIASQSDISIVPGQSANLTVALERGVQLEYHINTNATPPTLALWAEIKSSRQAGQMLGALATQLPVSPGRVVEAGELVTASGAYELRVAFSTAAMPGAAPSVTPKPGRANGS